MAGLGHRSSISSAIADRQLRKGLVHIKDDLSGGVELGRGETLSRARMVASVVVAAAFSFHY